jgi:integrase
MIDGATQPLKVMLLLAINAGLGNADIAKLHFKAINMKTGWLTYPRGKTGVMRRCPLWPETIGRSRNGARNGRRRRIRRTLIWFS